MTIKVVFNRNGKRRTKRYKVIQINSDGRVPFVSLLLTNTLKHVIIDLREVESFEWNKERL